MELLGHRGLTLYAINSVGPSGTPMSASPVVSCGEALSPKTISVDEGQHVLGKWHLEPCAFQGETLGFLAAQTNQEEIKSLASQIACLLHSKNHGQTISIDRLVEKMHNDHDKYHWTGIYLLNENGKLALEAFRGEPTPHMVIPVNQGICGAAVREKKTLNIADVSSDPRYLSCSIKTKSEIVVPISIDGRVVGEIDIDSHEKNAFSQIDEKQLAGDAEKIAVLLALGSDSR